MRVPFNDPARQVRDLRHELGQALDSVVDSGWFIHGRSHQSFEAAFAEYCGVAACVGVANGTDALEIALRAVGCGPGTEVVTVANAGGYTTTACLAAGATPVFADVDAETLEMSPRALEQVLSPSTKAVVITHLYGQMAEVEALSALARSRGIAVIEDCAQAHGAVRGDKKAGSFGDLACFSFYPTKNLGALGDGGAIVTDNRELAERCTMLRQYGWAGKYDARIAGGRNSRLDEMQAAVLLVKLPHLDGWNERRRAIAAHY
ncbi:DegT/DnrJ/EryC1/StrS family aminotransferase, partial [bacterium]|nr:DegT/DnrJ/EryC1/StrS family aminotransferase [bacterium]